MAGQRVKWFDREIWLDEYYYVYFYDKKRKMTDTQLQTYNQIRSLPDKLRYRELAQMDPRDNPNVTPMTGRQLMDAGAKGYIPTFDKFFDRTRRLVLFPAEAWEYYEKHSFMLRNK